MTFKQEFFLTVLDGLVLGVIITLFSYWLDRRLEKFRKQEDFRHQQTVARTQAYLRLWSLMEPLSPSAAKDLSDDERMDLAEVLRAWYYDQGNGLYLPIETTKAFLNGHAALARLDQSLDTVRRLFSDVRTQMKRDAGTYTKDDAKTPIAPTISGA